MEKIEIKTEYKFICVYTRTGEQEIVEISAPTYFDAMEYFLAYLKQNDKEDDSRLIIIRNKGDVPTISFG